MRYENSDLSHQTVRVDGNEFIGCTFRDSTLIIEASGAESRISRCEFLKPWRLAWGGSAEQTLKTLSSLYQQSSEKAALVGVLFDDIRHQRDPRATLAQLSWDQLKQRPWALYTVQAMMQWYAQGSHGGETIETLFADIRSGDFRQLYEIPPTAPKN